MVIFIIFTLFIVINIAIVYDVSNKTLREIMAFSIFVNGLYIINIKYQFLIYHLLTNLYFRFILHLFT
jgi:hypothetical protein